MKSATESRARWWQRGVVYQIYPRSFQDTNGDGVGDLAGIVERLDYLAWLGIDAIWISPFFPSPMKDFGYDVANYVDVDPLFGDLAMFDRLVVEARKRNIDIIIDYVPNHSSDQHAWFLESRAARESERRDWYVWADARPDGGPPNNWVSVFGGRAWTWDEKTKQYYLHTFLREQPDLNWRNPAVASAMLDVLRFWLDRGVSGFRIDAPLFVMKDPAMRDDPPNASGRAAIHRPQGDYDTLVHVHSAGHPDVHAVFRRFRKVLDEYEGSGHKVSIGEVHVFDWEEWARFYGEDLDEFHMPFNFGLLNVTWRAREIGALVSAIEANLREGAWPNYVLGNHDEPRIASRLGQARARLATMLLFTLRGTPTLYYGDELGMPNVPIPPDRVMDPPEKHAPGNGYGRDPERTPMQWDATPNAGFCPADATPWLPIADDAAVRNVAVQRADPQSMLSLTRALLDLRRRSGPLHSGSYREIIDAGEDVLAFVREQGAQRFLVALNFADKERVARLWSAAGSAPAATESARIVLSTHLDREGAVDLTALTLRGDEGCIIEL